MSTVLFKGYNVLCVSMALVELNSKTMSGWPPALTVEMSI